MTKINTKLVQPDFKARGNFKSLADSVERASTVVFDNVEKLRQRDFRDKEQYTYGLLGTPTSRRLEQQLAAIDGVEHALLLPSGLSAISTVMFTLLKTGDYVYLPYNVYVPALEVAKYMHMQFGVEFVWYDPLDISHLTLKPNTKLVWVETPGSVTMEVSDLTAIANVAHQHGALVAIDATWAAGIALPVFKLGADISIQALTKYQSGGSDVMMGCITTANDKIYQALLLSSVTLGSGVSPEDCRLILRSLPHYALRYHTQDKSARRIATWLTQHPTVLQVLHPAIEGAPGHAIWSRDFTAAASLFSVVFKAHINQDQIDKCVEAMTLFHLGFSWGGAVSLVVPFTRNQMHQTYSYQGLLVRFYIGLEDEDDLIQDLTQALSVKI
ncbi:MAG: aminotransferase class V-fold PLP-dependent enzyme [Methylophilaceae bacterium]|nr:MAG: aminotransferase class V-fold PLP-dependent enzyme [Methylophilaceae bacterium]